MAEKIEDYEESEQAAIESGQRALAEASWINSRTVPESSGFFFELKENDVIHPGHFAVHCVDGVGTKLFYSAWSGDFYSPAIDAIAMNANDMATAMHAFPDTVDLYFAVQPDVKNLHMGDIMAGFRDAIDRLRVDFAPFQPNIGKMETASLEEMISLGVPGKGWDVGVVMTGFIEKSKIPVLQPKPGHIIVGVSSTGTHSNGHTAARHVLFSPKAEYRNEWKDAYTGSLRLDARPEILEGNTLLEVLKVPTALYLAEALEIGREFDSRDIYGVNITGNGLHNFNRVGEGVSFEITNPLEMLPIHRLLIQASGWTPQQAYIKQNMGMGFAYIFPTLDTAERAMDIINKRGENQARIIGEVRESKEPELITRLHKPYEGKMLEFKGYN